MKDASSYLALPYTKTIRRDEDGDFVARVMELPGCLAHGRTEMEAIENLLDVQTVWIAEALAAGVSVPEPETDDGLPSGRWLQRVPRTLHRKLVEFARREGVSLNQFVVFVLAEAVGNRQAQARHKRPLRALEYSNLGSIEAINWFYYGGPPVDISSLTSGNVLVRFPELLPVQSGESTLDLVGTWASLGSAPSGNARLTAKAAAEPLR